MPEEPADRALSKRERQKQRRHEKLAAQKAAQRAARRKRVVATGAVVALLVVATGALAYGWVFDRVTERRLMAAAGERLDELGCGDVVEEPILPSQHLAGAELPTNSPEDLYPERPATSGRHLGAVARTGVYDKVIDERLLVHNLEHGYVNLYYHQEAPAEQVDALKAFGREQIDSRRHEKIVVSEWKADLDGGANFAYVAWGARQLCRDFDEGVALSFLRDHHYLAGSAPERELQPHLADGIDPDEEEGDLLFPPLDVADADALEDALEDAMEEPDGG